MIVRYLGDSDPLSLINGKEYEVLAIECGWYRIIDEEGYDPEFDEIPGYLYPPNPFLFEIVSGSRDEFPDDGEDDFEDYTEEDWREACNELESGLTTV